MISCDKAKVVGTEWPSVMGCKLLEVSDPVWSGESLDG